MKAKHPRFEVEDVIQRRNYTFSLIDGCVRLHDTSRGHGNQLMEVYGPDKFPSVNFKGDLVGSETAEAYYDVLYEKALIGEGHIFFLGYVDDNFQPIEEES